MIVCMRSVHARHRFRYGLILLLAMALAACSGELTDLQEWVAREQADSASPSPSTPTMTYADADIHVSVDGRDPFVLGQSDALEQPVEQHEHQPDRSRARQPLEQFALDELRMVGTLGTGRGMRALVQDSENTLHRVQINQYMGRNHGQVVNISESDIELRELVRNGAGGWQPQVSHVPLTGDSDKHEGQNNDGN